MDKDKQTVHYCTILSGEQWDFILEVDFPPKGKDACTADDPCRADKDRL